MSTESDVRYVAYLDMLGMGNLSLSSPDLAWQAVCRLDTARQDLVKKLAIKMVTTGKVIRISDRVRTFIFSDTIVAFTKSDEEDDAFAIVFLVEELLARYLNYCIPMRGGIARGRFLVSEEHGLFVGPALVRAHSLSEGAQWVGVCVDQETRTRAESIPILRPLVVPWPVPFKDGETTDCVVLDWVKPHRNNFTVKPPIGAAQFYEPFAPMFGPFENLRDEVRRKYENTVRFVNERLML